MEGSWWMEWTWLDGKILVGWRGLDLMESAGWMEGSCLDEEILVG